MLCENVDNYKRRNEIINGSNRPLERLLVFCFVFTFMNRFMTSVSLIAEKMRSIVGSRT
jgi:ABC-type amino acid transport system permease subunit